MKKVLLVLSLVFSFILLQPNFVKADEGIDYVKNFQADVKLNSDASIDITENINYHFDGYNHGIYREIPVDYVVNGFMKRPTQLILNDLYYYENSNPSAKFNSYSKSKSNGYVVLEIGDADTGITGDYTFVISYKLIYAVNYFNDHDELYLNILGNYWEVPIESAIANIEVPGNIEDKVCYVGESYTSNDGCTFSSETNNTFSVTAENLAVNEGLTIGVSMPLNTIANTSSQQRVQYVLANIGLFLFIPVLVFVVIFVKRNNKNKKLTIVPTYEAPEVINVATSGYIYKKSLANNAITAQLIQLAIDGYIQITQEDSKNYVLTKTKLVPDDPSEKILYDGLFEGKDTVNINDLDQKFYTTVQKLKNSVEKSLFQSDIFSKSQKNLKKTFNTLGIVCLCVVFALMEYFLSNAAGGWALGIIFSGIILLIGSSLVDVRTTKGNEIYYELEGLKLYINTAEKRRIEYHNDPRKYSKLFEKLLPYAMIFGLEKKWAKEFEDIYTEPPKWYSGDLDTFNSYVFINTLSRMNTRMISNAMPSRASSYGFSSSHGASGGSAFSGGHGGGGFGGGGGGSW